MLHEEHTVPHHKTGSTQCRVQHVCALYSVLFNISRMLLSNKIIFHLLTGEPQFVSAILFQ